MIMNLNGEKRDFYKICKKKAKQNQHESIHKRNIIYDPEKNVVSLMRMRIKIHDDL